MNAWISRVIGILLAAVLLAGCTDSAAAPTATPTGALPVPAEQGAVVALNVMTHDSFAASEVVIRQFEQENRIQINFIKAGDAGSMVNRAILSKGAPMADVLFGIDNTFLSRALEEDIFEPYASPLLANIPQEFKLDAQNRALPVDYGDVCINYDKAYFAENNLAVPQSLADLTKPEYNGLLVVQNPATSSPGLAFLLATIAEFGTEGYLDFWRDLRANGVVVANDWEAAYYTNFSGSSGQGPQPMVVSYNASPVAEVVFAETQITESPTASITAPGTCFRQVEFTGILKGTQQREAAEKFIDFLLSVPFQEDIPLQMFVYPVNPDAKLPEPYLQFSQIPEQPASVDMEEIARNRETWVQAWDEAVLR
jgi:thiamine transport system substrate-binding protein